MPEQGKGTDDNLLPLGDWLYLEYRILPIKTPPPLFFEQQL